MNFFSKSVYSKILYIVGILELIMTALAILSYFTITILNQRDKVRKLESGIYFITQIRTDFSKIRNIGLVDRFNSKNAELDTLLNDFEFQDELINFKNTKNKYSELIEEYIEKVKSRGLDENKGIEGEFRDIIHKIENKVLNSKNKELIIELLQARRSEKDFIMRQSDKYIAKVESAVAKFKIQLNKANFNRNEELELSVLADDYLTYFHKFVDIIADIRAYEKTLDYYEKTLESLSEKIVKEKSTTADKIQLALIIIVIVTTIFSIIWAIRIAKAISRPLTELIQSVDKIAAGNYDAYVQIKSRDEIGSLAKTFNKMVSNLKVSKEIISEQQDELVNANLELENRVEERTYQLEDALEELKIEIDNKNELSKELIVAHENLELALQKEKELNELKTRFVAMVSHEYRTPLTVILSSTYILEKCKIHGKEDLFNDQLYKIQDSVKLMTALLEDVLILGKSDSGRVDTRYTEFDLVEFLRKSIDNMKYVDMGKHLIKYNADKSRININSDPIIINHILSNLLSNAAKYSDAGSEISVSVDADYDYAVFSVEDSGIGIPADDLEYLFEPFHRSQNVGTISGTGLGLTIAKRLIETLHGKIFVESEVGKGTKFTVRLPMNNNHKLN